MASFGGIRGCQAMTRCGYCTLSDEGWRDNRVPRRMIRRALEEIHQHGSVTIRIRFDDEL